jgi:hypothetical protein
MSKVLIGLLVLLGLAFFFSSRDSARFQAMTPAEQYEERCKQNWKAPTMAESSLRQFLNVADIPRFEVVDHLKIVRSERNATNDCLFTVEGHITFKNESGGQSRRFARVVVGPKRGDNDNWLMFAIDVR